MFPVISQTIAATPPLLSFKMAYRNPKTHREGRSEREERNHRPPRFEPRFHICCVETTHSTPAIIQSRKLKFSLFFPGFPCSFPLEKTYGDARTTKPFGSGKGAHYKSGLFTARIANICEFSRLSSVSQKSSHSLCFSTRWRLPRMVHLPSPPKLFLQSISAV